MRRASTGSVGLVLLLLATPAFGQAPQPEPKPAPAPRQPPRLRQPGRPALPLRAAPKKPPAAAAPAAPAPAAPPPAPAVPAPAALPPPEPPGARGPLPSTMDAIAKATDVPYKAMPPGKRVRFNLQDADLAELVNHISGLTGRRFIYGPKVRQIKATVVAPEPISLAEAYQAFLSILEQNGMTVVPHGRFLKIVDSGGVVALPAPVYSRGAPVPDEDRYITRLYRLENVSAEEMSALLTKFKSKEGDISIHSPGRLLIITDTGANIRRMIRIIEEVDVGGAGQRMWIEPVNHGSATEMAKRINELFELSAAPGAPGQPGAPGRGGASGLEKVLADEQTNSLIIVGTEDSYTKLLELMQRLDTTSTGDGRVRVLALQHAQADDLANTLNQMLQGAAARPPGQPGAPPGGGTAAGMFEGEVRVTADKATNSLVITSTGHDYAAMRLVIDQLDMPRRQVFIEAVIMDLSIDHSTTLGMAFHGGNTVGADDTLLLGGFNAGTSIAFPQDPNLLQGAAAGIRGPDIEGIDNIGISIPAFGVVLQAVASSSDTNILATPHILATDNVPAEINVGANIPLQTNFGGVPSLGNLGSLFGAAGAQGQNQAFNPLALAGLGGGFNTPRQDIGTKLKITPHLNESDQVRLEIEEEISEQQGTAAGALGAISISKRTAKTTVVVDDQQTVVIGGLMRDAVVRTRTKVPVLGDLPVLGFLFRRTENRNTKSNLLLILTPHVIQEQNDLRKIFERKMQERQEFLDRYFVFSGQDWEPPRDYTKTNGLVEDIRQSFFLVEEQLRLEEESKPREQREHLPSEPIELPGTVRAAPVTPGAPAPAAPAAPAVPRRRRPVPAAPVPAAPAPAPAPAPPPPAPPQPQGALDSPIRINPISRAVNVERTE